MQETPSWDRSVLPHRHAAGILASVPSTATDLIRLVESSK